MNNFDQSSTGLNITVSAFYDTDLSRIYFDEAFFTIKEGRKDLLVYCKGNFSDFEKEYIFTKAELLSAWSKIETKEDFLNNFRFNMGFGYSKATKQDLIDYCKQSCYYLENWHKFCEDSGFKSNFEIVVSRGYCQGDYQEVIVPNEFWDKIGTKKPESVQSELGTYINHLLWDCPVTCYFTVNDEDFYIDQELKDSYNWDKNEALEIAKNLIKNDFTTEEQTIIMDFLSKSLKDSLNYV